MITKEQIQLFNSLFKGREDVFALRWEKTNKSGYMPAYSYDPYMYRLHKERGGTFKDYKDKTYLKLDDYQLSKHYNNRTIFWRRHGYPKYFLLVSRVSFFV